MNGGTNSTSATSAPGKMSPQSAGRQSPQGWFDAGTDTMTQTTNAPGWIQDAASTYLTRANEVSTNPYTASPNQAVGPNDYQSTAWDAIKNRALNGSPVQSAGNEALLKTLNGGYLDSNPYIDGLVDKAQGDLVRNYNHVVRPGQDASMIRSGSFGNSGLQQQTQDQDRQLQDSLGNISTQIRGGAYEAERNRMQSGLGYVPQFANQDYNDADRLLKAGNEQNQFAREQAGQNYKWWEEANNYPGQQLGIFGNAINNVMGSGRTSTTQTPGTSPLSQGVGTALTLSQLLGLFGQGG